MNTFLRGRTPSGQRVAFAATNIVIVDRYVDDKPVFGQSVVHLPGLPPLILEGTPADIIEQRDLPSPLSIDPKPNPGVLEIPPTGTNEA